MRLHSTNHHPPCHDRHRAALLLGALAMAAAGWSPSAARAQVRRSSAPSSATCPGGADGPDGATAPRLLRHTTAIAYQKRHRNADLHAWRQRTPPVDVVEIRSSKDGQRQRTLFYHSGSAHPKPLLVALHSWSADYQQNLNIPFAEFAIENDWVFLHPDFRGPNNRPQAASSELAVQDVLDAVRFARKRAAVDPSRIYLIGYSGGAMAALVLAGRHPGLWAGVAAWGVIHDIPDWYWHEHSEDDHYRAEIAAACGGVPHPGSAAESECRRRSPLADLEHAAGRVPILLAHGLRDRTVPPRHALRAYDTLAAPADRFTDQQRAHIDARGHVPRELRAHAGGRDPLHDRAGAPVRLRRRSQAVTLVLFKGGHDMVYNAGLCWLAEQRQGQSTLASKDPPPARAHAGARAQP